MITTILVTIATTLFVILFIFANSRLGEVFNVALKVHLDTKNNKPQKTVSKKSHFTVDSRGNTMRS